MHYRYRICNFVAKLFHSLFFCVNDTTNNLFNFSLLGILLLSNIFVISNFYDYCLGVNIWFYFDFSTSFLFYLKWKLFNTFESKVETRNFLFPNTFFFFFNEKITIFRNYIAQNAFNSLCDVLRIIILRISFQIWLFLMPKIEFFFCILCMKNAAQHLPLNYRFPLFHDFVSYIILLFHVWISIDVCVCVCMRN